MKYQEFKSIMKRILVSCKYKFLITHIVCWSIFCLFLSLSGMAISSIFMF